MVDVRFDSMLRCGMAILAGDWAAVLCEESWVLTFACATEEMFGPLVKNLLAH